MLSADRLLPTPYPDVNALLETLLTGMQAVLGSRLIGFYLDGSLANGGFDEDSDIDFVAVTEGRISEPVFLELQAYHDRIARLDSIWAIQLEGSYLSRRAVRRYDPADCLYPNIERGRGERLKWVRHDPWWDVHRSILRTRGICILGPAPETLIDPVEPDALRQAMRSVLWEWAAHFLDDPTGMNSRGYQSYTVLSMCRVLYTLQFGSVASKPDAARWAAETLDPHWKALIDRAWTGRHQSGGAPDPQDVEETQAFIRYILTAARSYGLN
jgi:predicted nucleotidyltransferase